MPLSSTCRNCGLPKNISNYADNYCSDCTTAVKEAREFAIRENTDIGTSQRKALAERAHDAHRNHVDPRYPVTKADYWVPPEVT